MEFSLDLTIKGLSIRVKAYEENSGILSWKYISKIVYVSLDIRFLSE